MLLPMTPRTRKTAAALTGALVLASGAYALGSQAGDGSALAGDNAGPRGAGFGYGGPGPGPGRPHARFESLADQLGVSEAKLREALRAVRDDRKDDHAQIRDAVVKALASELGISEAKVKAAFDKRMADRQGGRKLRRDGRRGTLRDAFAAQLAKELGVDAAKVRDALDDLRPRPGTPPDLGAIAAKIGVSEAELRDALAAVRPALRGPRPPRGLQRRGQERLESLAQDLGVKPADLRAALRDIREDLAKQRDAARDRFAADLAKELGISADKVEDALDSLPHHGRRGP
jgi:biotin operon repressor